MQFYDDIKNSDCNRLFKNKELKGRFRDEVLHELGQFLEIVSRIEKKQEVNIKSFLHWVKPAILHDQYILLMNDGDIEPSGYVMWAWVDNITLEDFFSKKRFSLHPMCWNDGENLIVVDFVMAGDPFPSSAIRKLFRWCRKSTEISHKMINVSIRDDEGNVVKTIRAS